MSSSGFSEKFGLWRATSPEMVELLRRQRILVKALDRVPKLVFEVESMAEGGIQRRREDLDKEGRRREESAETCLGQRDSI